MRISTFLLLVLVSAGAPSSAQAPSSGAIQSNQPTSPPGSPAKEVTGPELVGSEACAYPPLAVRLNQQGTTVVTVHVNSNGMVGDVTVKNSSGHEALDAATVKCAQTWTYRPATRNGIPADADVEREIRWSIEGGTPPPPIPFLPPGSPVGWEHENSSLIMGGLLASYKLSQPPTAEQYLSARAYPNVSDLGALVAEVDANLKNVRGLHLLSEGPTKLCNGESASEIEYSQPGLVAADSTRILDVEQVRTVKNGWAYVTTYIRPAESPKRPDAEQWIYGFCQSTDGTSKPRAETLRTAGSHVKSVDAIH